MSFTFSTRPNEPITVSEAVGQALGAASMCWSETPSGVFDSERATEIYKALEKVITTEASWSEPHLGLARTRQLLDELTSRIRVDYFAGGGGLDYSTVKGRPGGPDLIEIESRPTSEPIGC